MELVINWAIPGLLGVAALCGGVMGGVIWGRGTVQPEPCNRRHADEVK